VPVVVDERVLETAEAFLTAGSNETTLRLDGRSLRLALAGADKGRFCLVERTSNPATATSGELSLEEVARRLEKLYQLPPMPALSLRILRLTGDNNATAGELATLIECDPSVTAQVMRYSRSALFNYPGQINSVQDAVTRVLGFDRVAHIAMGIASVRAFDVPRDGPLGMNTFWRHSLYCAYLCQQMAAHRSLDSREPVDRGLAYLCGLLHNFGLLLIGHLFPEEFDQLNRLREANPEPSMRTLEARVFGASQELLAVGHGAIGGILHRLWQLPDEVVKSAGMHQQPDYEGSHATYVGMVQLANGLLKQRGIGDEFNDEDLEPLAKALGFAEPDLEEFERLIDEASGELDALAQHLS
jgi:HD-like signal output (HDOD) protein